MNILNKLTIKHLAMNKRRTIVTIVGIILSTSLMVGIGLLLSTMREIMIDDIISNKGNYHTTFLDIDNKNVSKIEKNINIDTLIKKEFLGKSKIDNQTDYYNIYGADKDYLEHIKVLKGRLPKNDTEIVVPNHVISDYNLDIKLNDKLNLVIGDRANYDFEEQYSKNEYLENTVNKEYTVVGIIEKDIFEGSILGYNLYTVPSNTKNLDIIVTYKKPTKTYDITENIAKTIKISKEEFNKHIVYNDSLLSMYGLSTYGNFTQAITGILIIMLGLVSIACIIVIYNSFAISVMERKKQFGLFSSIGATRKQLKRTVLFEAMIVSIIGIPLGILGAYLGISVVLVILNNLMGEAIFEEISFKLVTYPLFLIIPIIFMILTILVSAFLPARRASKISPIEAIRLNDDIKIKGKKVKTPRFIKKIFGVEGDLALKSMKRNKKKYRITIVSLVISIVMFISFSAFMEYTLDSAIDYVSLPEFDIQVSYNEDTNKTVINKIRNNQDVKDSIVYAEQAYSLKTDYDKLLDPKYIKFLKKFKYYNNLPNEISHMFIFDDKDYNAYLKKLGKTKPRPILFNKYSSVIYEKTKAGASTRKVYRLNKYNNNKPKLSIYYYETLITEFDNYYISDIPFLSSEMIENLRGVSIILSKSMYNEIKNHRNFDREYLILKAPKYNDVKKVINDYIESGILDKNSYININERMKLISNLILGIKILVYGFITLVTLIGVTSVFNTINTSIQLRRKEFAVLRSIGLTPMGFNKMLCLESLFFGIKSILYGLPISFIIIYLINFSMDEIVSSQGLLIPWDSIVIAIIGVFIVIGISTIYSTRKIKNENILDAIREENI